MKIKPAPINTFALAHSITQDEWKALRAAVARIENTVGRRMDDTYLANTPATVMPKIIEHYALHEIRGILHEEGLNPDDWFVYLAPVLPEGPLPPQIEEWTLHMRLLTEISRAKAVAIEKNNPRGYIEKPFPKD